MYGFFLRHDLQLIYFSKRWTTLLWGSRDVATKTEAYIKGTFLSNSSCSQLDALYLDFVEIIVPIVEEIQTADDLADARLDLNAFIKVYMPSQFPLLPLIILQRTDPYGNYLNSSETVDAAQKYSQAFTDLRRDLEEFSGTFESFAKDHEVALGNDIIQKQGDIDRLNIEIKQ